MAVKDMEGLLKHELGDLLFAEKTVLKALKKQIKETTNAEMRARLEQHLGETESHVENIESAFEAAGIKVKAEKCPGILGLVKEKEEFVSEEKPSKQVLQVFNVGAALRVEHYEIAAYTGAISLARALGQREAADLLGRNLADEKAMLSFLEANGARAVRETVESLDTSEATQKNRAQFGSGSSSGRSTGGSGRAGAKSTSKSAGAAKRGAGKSGAKSGAKSGRGTRGGSNRMSAAGSGLE